jgi:hypothetical protein
MPIFLYFIVNHRFRIGPVDPSANDFQRFVGLPAAAFVVSLASGNGNFLPASSLFEVFPVATLAGSSEEQPALTRAPTIATIPIINLNTYRNLFIAIRAPRGKNAGRPRRWVTDDPNPNADPNNVPSRLKGSSSLAAEPGDRQKSPTLNCWDLWPKLLGRRHAHDRQSAHAHRQPGIHRLM